MQNSLATVESAPPGRSYRIKRTADIGDVARPHYVE